MEFFKPTKTDGREKKKKDKIIKLENNHWQDSYIIFSLYY